MDKPTTYLISVIIRDENGKIVEDKKGIRTTSIEFEKTVHNYKQLEFQMRTLHRQFKTFLPTHEINIEAGVNNSIGGTIMNMASFYGSEDRFVKH
jgi:hypothetical protein